jgi:succinate dehydrogenase/fumarate reductase flavoprotein subunit
MADNRVQGDVLVIGAGIGGVSAAISAKESGRVDKVVLIEKSHAGRTGPSALVGGIFSGILPEDNPDAKLKNTLENEHNYPLPDQEAFERLISQGLKTVATLERWGVKFVKQPDGKYHRVFQRGGLTMRIQGGGIPMMQALIHHALKIGVTILNWVTITDLLTRDGAVVGAVGLSCRTGELFLFKSNTTVLATGGTIVKSRQPGHRQLSGDGWAMAYHAGAEIADMSFSKSNIYGATLEVGPGNGLYLSQGARLLNNKMEEYIKNYPEIESLGTPEGHAAPQAMEARRGNAPPIWLDLRHFTPRQVDMIYESIPYAAKRWEKLGFIKDKKFVKLCEYAPEGPRPAGGVFVDVGSFEARNLRGLFICGEASAGFQCSAGLHNCASSGIVAGASAAEKASGMKEAEIDPKQVKELGEIAMAPVKRKKGIEPEYVLTMFQETVHPYYVYILRSEKYLKKALSEIVDIRDNLLPYLHAYDPHYLRLAHDIRNLVLVAEMFLQSALARKESRYNALRDDYPYMDNINWLKWLIVTKDQANGEMKIKTADMPTERYKLKPKREKILHPFWARAEELGYWKRPKEK